MSVDVSSARSWSVAGALVREQLDAQRRATVTDRFVAGVLGGWLEQHPQDGELVSAAVDRVAAGLWLGSRRPFGLVFDLPGFYRMVEAVAGVSLPEWCDEGFCGCVTVDEVDEEVRW